jgi:tetratricopeptide (TPR) repeat protein
MPRALAVICLALLLACQRAGAQSVPDRPPLRAAQTQKDAPVSVDTNDAQMYYAAGVASHATNPVGAAAAFYWASRIDPSWAEPYFARWYVLSKLAGGGGIDSLGVIAYGRDPFFDEALALGDIRQVVVTGYSTTITSRQVTTTSPGRPGMYENQPGFQDVPAPPIPPPIAVVHTWYAAYANHDFASAASQLRDALKKNPDAIELYSYRAKAQFYLGQFDSAAATLRLAIGRLDALHPTKPLRVFLSKEAFTYAIGIAQQHAGHDSAAHAAFQATVAANPAFYMAHVHLSALATTAGDTTTALAEMQRAADIAPTDPVVQLFLGYSLLDANRPADAVTHLNAAIRADSEYALPYLYLGQAHVTLHDTTDALAALRGFLTHARRDDDHRVIAQSQIDMFTTSAGGAAH